MTGMQVTGIVLAAGAGTRYGRPKALVRDPDGTPWLSRVAAALRGGGCSEVIVVVGAAPEAAALAPAGARVVAAEDWATGLSRSVAAGVRAADGADAVLLAPVDVPALPATAVARVREAGEPRGRQALVRATYGGAPGHPVLLGAAHLAPLLAGLRGDAGAGAYLARAGAEEVACGDLWDGRDVDAPG